DHRHEPRAGEAGADDRVAVFWSEGRRGLHRQTGPAAGADAADGGAIGPPTHLRTFPRGFFRSPGGETLLPRLLRRGGFSTRGGVRPFVVDALAPADGRGEASGAAAGEPSGGDPDGCDEAVRSCPCCDRYDGAAEGGDVPDRCQAAQPGARAAGATDEEARS